MIDGRLRPASRPSRRRCFLASRRVEPLIERTPSSSSLRRRRHCRCATGSACAARGPARPCSAGRRSRAGRPRFRRGDAGGDAAGCRRRLSLRRPSRPRHRIRRPRRRSRSSTAPAGGRAVVAGLGHAVALGRARAATAPSTPAASAAPSWAAFLGALVEPLLCRLTGVVVRLSVRHGVSAGAAFFAVRRRGAGAGCLRRLEEQGRARGGYRHLRGVTVQAICARNCRGRLTVRRVRGSSSVCASGGAAEGAVVRFRVRLAALTGSAGSAGRPARSSGPGPRRWPQWPWRWPSSSSACGRPSSRPARPRLRRQWRQCRRLRHRPGGPARPRPVPVCPSGGPTRGRRRCGRARWAGRAAAAGRGGGRRAPGRALGGRVV